LISRVLAEPVFGRGAEAIKFSFSLARFSGMRAMVGAR
jgi:hypothetical protein